MILLILIHQFNKKAQLKTIIMKNENNTQHTPGLDLSWENAKDGILVFFPHVSGGRPDLIHVSRIEDHKKRCDEQTAGNVEALYVPYLLAVHAPELLKENEQLKDDVSRLIDLLAQSNVAYNNLLQDRDPDTRIAILNAELLEALKEQNNVISGFAGIEAWITDRELKEKWQAKVYPSIQKSNSAIAKAEGKILSVS